VACGHKESSASPFSFPVLSFWEMSFPFRELSVANATTFAPIGLLQIVVKKVSDGLFLQVNKKELEEIIESFRPD